MIKSVDTLPRNSKLLLIITLSSAIIGGWYLIRFQPRQAQLTQLSEELQSNHEKLEQARRDVASVPQLRKQIEAERLSVKNIKKALPERLEVGKLKSEIENAAKESGAKIENLNFTPLNPEQAGLAPLGLEISLKGSYTQVMQASNQIENLERFLKTQQIQSSIDKGMVTQKLRLEAYIRTPAQNPSANKTTEPLSNEKASQP